MISDDQLSWNCNKFLFLEYSRRSVNAEIQSDDNCITEEKLRKKKYISSSEDLKAAGTELDL